jgi:hypothetical protein
MKMNAIPKIAFRNVAPLSEDEIRKVAPSVFATERWHERSERFQPIPTIEVLRGLRSEGFEVYGVKQSRSRIEGKADYTKHALRIRHVDFARDYQVGDTIAETLLTNGQDGTSSYHLRLALFRIRCLNGLVCNLATLDEVKIRHTGSLETVQHRVIEGTTNVLKSAQLALAAPQDWASIRVEAEEAQVFAKAAHQLRFDYDEDGNAQTPITPEQLLIPRRPEDQQANLWNVFNVTQENVIKGGLTGTNAHQRRVTTREVKGIDQDIRLNKALWTLADEFAKLKRAA